MSIETLKLMLSHKQPEYAKSQVWRRDVRKWYRQASELARLERRRPEIYERGMATLVNYIADRIAAENEQFRQSDYNARKINGSEEQG